MATQFRQLNDGWNAEPNAPYANRPESDLRWPETTMFASIEDWMERGMKQDHDDFTA